MGSQEENLRKKSWEEFRDSGLLWFINSILHLFGWSLVYYYDNKDDMSGEPTRVYPARTKFRGFTEKATTDGYIKVSKYLKENIDELLDEAKN